MALKSAKRPASREPRQARSQRTLDALLDAAQQLLADRPFHDINVNEIIARAGSSAGSFYARFPDKQALLHALHDRFNQRGKELGAALRTALTLPPDSPPPSRAQGRQLAQLIIGNIVKGLQENRGVLRAVAIECFHDQRLLETAWDGRDSMRDVVCDIMRPFRGDTPADQFDQTVAFALRMVIATMDQMLFIPPSAQARLDADSAAIAPQLINAFIRQLQLE